MPKAHTDLVNDVEAILQDSANEVWTAATLQDDLDRAIRELSRLDPYTVLITLELESRTGQATATTAGALVDTTESQFLAGDVGKVLFNSTDNTWTIVDAFVSTSQLTLARDIMVSGESYELYNQDCWDRLQLYLGSVEGYVGPNRGVEAVYYPAQGSRRTQRNFRVDGRVLTLEYDGSVGDSKQANLRSRIVDVDIWIRRNHFVTRLTDLTGAVDLGAGYSKGDTLVHMDALAASEVIKEGQEFTIAGLRGRYWVTVDTTLASNEGDVTFFPPLDNALADDDVVTLAQSSLDTRQEDLVAELAAGRAAINMGAKLLQQANDAITQNDLYNARVDSSQAVLDESRALLNRVNRGGPSTAGLYATQAAQEAATGGAYGSAAGNYLAIAERAREFRIWGQGKVDQAIRDIRSVRPPRQKRTYSRS